MTAAIQKIIDEATQRLVAEFQPEQVWLFGSYAWGEPNKDSDLDLLVVVPSSNETTIRRMQRAQASMVGLDASADILVNTSEEVDRVKHLRSSIAHKILNEGRLIYG
jgi:predicted nucleotidyltransferase